MADNLQIERAEVKDIIVLRPAGRVDLVGYPTFKDALDELLRDGHEKVILNLSGVDFINSSGMGALMSFTQTQARDGRAAVIAAPSRACVQLIDTLQLRDIFRVMGTEDAAIKELSR